MAEFVTSISDFARSQVYRWTDPADWRKVHVVHCGVDASFLGRKPEEIPTAPRVVCVGRLSRAKGHLLLIRAVSRLVAEGQELELLMIGEMRERGIVPDHYTAITKCKYCGPVPIFDGLPEKVNGCPWCFNRIKGLPIPTER